MIDAYYEINSVGVVIMIFSKLQLSHLVIYFTKNATSFSNEAVIVVHQ